MNLDELLETEENAYLLKLATSRENNQTTDFEIFVEEQGFSMDELEKLAESIEVL